MQFLNKMSLLKEIKKAGYQSVAQMEHETGISRQCMTNWRKNRPKLYAIILQAKSDRLLIERIASEEMVQEQNHLV